MYVTKAAIMFSNGEVVEGRDYGFIISLAHKLSFDSAEKIHGFVTSTNKFVLPEEASEIALGSHQIEKSIPNIAPEDLWGTPALERDL